ncbi:MAG: lytic transglycosylase domain-containing protein [Alphaproteobacteria bacterium]|nr:lytic transglycosylase domain-containing protein [Alphaproteobacteria bacterium]
MPAPRLRPSSFPARKRRDAPIALHLHGLLIASGVSIMLIVTGAPSYAQPAAVQHVSRPSTAAPFAPFVAEASRRFGIPAARIRAVMRAESFGDAHAISPKGAMGLMQIMPETWAALRRRYGFGANPYDAHDNIMAGAAYLRELHDRYGIPGFLAAYNAGPARWEDFVTAGRPLPAETRAYLAKLAPIVGGAATDDTVLLTTIMRSWTEAALFPAQGSSTSGDTKAAPRPQPSSTPTVIPPQDWTGLAPQSDGLFVSLSSGGRPQ